MTKFIAWFKDGSSKHYDTDEEIYAIRDKEIKTVTCELYTSKGYIGEYDISYDEFKETFSQFH